MPVAAFIRASATPAATAAPPAYDAPTLAAVKLALRIDEDHSDAILSRNIAAALALARKQAPNAPESVGHEAIIRCVGWLYEGGGLAIPDAGLWRRCGAQGLLRPWTKRRAGAIG